MNQKQAHKIVYGLMGTKGKLIAEAYMTLYPYTARKMLKEIMENENML